MPKMIPLWSCAWNRIRMTTVAAIDRADDAPDANCSVLRHLDFGNLRHIGGEGVLD